MRNKQEGFISEQHPIDFYKYVHVLLYESVVVFGELPVIGDSVSIRQNYSMRPIAESFSRHSQCLRILERVSIKSILKSMKIFRSMSADKFISECITYGFKIPVLPVKS